MSSLYSIGAMDQLSDALEKSGFSRDDVTKLKQFDNLKGIRDILYGWAEIKYPDHLIDLGADPFIPEGFSIEEHQKGGLWKWDPQFLVRLAKEQSRRGFKEKDWRLQLLDDDNLNVNVLSYLLKHQEIIPEEMEYGVTFWKTIYRDRGGNICVCSLGRDSSGWVRLYSWPASKY